MKMTLINLFFSYLSQVIINFDTFFASQPANQPTSRPMTDSSRSVSFPFCRAVGKQIPPRQKTMINRHLAFNISKLTKRVAKMLPPTMNRHIPQRYTPPPDRKWRFVLVGNTSIFRAVAAPFSANGAQSCFVAGGQQ